LAQRIEETIESTETLEYSEPARVVQIQNGKMTPWVEDTYVPNKPNKFRPVYVSLMLRISDALSNGLTFGEIMSEKHFGTYFISPVFNEPADHKYITDTLIPYLRAVAKAKHVSWNVVPSTKKGMLGVVVPGRLAASLLQGMGHVKPAIPYLFNFLFMEEA
jgi:hypothetical protein